MPAHTTNVKTKLWIIILISAVAIGSLAYILITTFVVPQLATSPIVETDYSFLVLDYVTGEEPKDADHDIKIYRANVEDLTQEEIEDLEFSDYTLDETKDSGETYTPDLEKYIYWIIADGDDFWAVQETPILGLNTIVLMNKTDDVAMVSFSKDEFSTTVVNSTYDKWTVLTQTLNGTEGEGNVTTSKEGFLPYYDFSANKNIRFIINVTVNTTAEISWLDLDSHTEDKFTVKVSGNDIILEIEETILGENKFELDFDSNIGTLYVPQSISIGYGYAGSITQWDTQA